MFKWFKSKEKEKENWRVTTRKNYPDSQLKLNNLKDYISKNYGDLSISVVSGSNINSHSLDVFHPLDDFEVALMDNLKFKKVDHLVFYLDDNYRVFYIIDIEHLIKRLSKLTKEELLQDEITYVDEELLAGELGNSYIFKINKGENFYFSIDGKNNKDNKSNLFKQKHQDEDKIKNIQTSIKQESIYSYMF